MGDLLGRDEGVAELVREIRKGKHLVLTGAVGVGKSALLRAALRVVEPRPSEWAQFDPVAAEAAPAVPPAPDPDRRVLVYVSETQAKAQCLQIARRLLETGLLDPAALELAETYRRMPPQAIPWKAIRRQVNRLSIRDLSGAILPALYAHPGRVLLAVDDMTHLTPTQQAFWLAVCEHAQLVTCASGRKPGLRKLWWRLTPIEVPALSPEAAAALVRDRIARQGLLIEAPELYVGHVVKQAGGNPQAIMDMLDASAKERLVNKRQIRAMQHAAGVRYADFTPVMLIAGACVIGTRYVAIGLGDTALYVLAGLGAALFLSLRVVLSRGPGRASA